MSRSNYINYLPQSMITEIFTHLPAKSLALCKCVSKSWNTLICDPHFIKTHLTKTSNNANHIIISSLGILHSVKIRNNLACEAHASEFSFDISNKWTRIWGSCDGLVLVEDSYGSKFLLSPTTSESKMLPSMPRGFCKARVFGFGYDISSDDYVVVAISAQSGSKKNACVYVYLLKKNLWKMVGFSPYDHDVHWMPAAGIFVNGCLHWLSKHVSDSSWLIAAFNTASEEFAEVALIDEVLDVLKFGRLSILNGCLCVVSNSRTELWVMEKYGVVESWVKLPLFFTEVSHVVSLNFPEDRLIKLECDQFVLLVSDAKEVTMYEYTEDGFVDPNQFGMTCSDSLVSLYNKDEKKKNKRRSKTTIRSLR